MNPSHSADSLGRLEDLPADYIADMTALSIAPLWPQLRGLLPRGKPSRATQPFVWHYQDVRPQLMRAGQLTHVSRSSRASRNTNAVALERSTTSFFIF